MYRTLGMSLLALPILVASLTFGAAGAALAQSQAAPGPVPGAAPCYAAMREDLGTVLPRGWRGYANEAACGQTIKNLPAAAPQPIANVAAKVDLSACYRALREDLGTVLASGWRGYANEAACGQTIKNLPAAAPQPIADVAAKVDLSACYRALREDLGAVLPGHDSSFLAAACGTR